MAAALAAAAAAFAADYQTHLTAILAARSARQAKQSARQALETVARQVARLAQADANLPDEQRRALGLKVPDRVRTAHPVPPTRPAARVVAETGGRHRVFFLDSETPTRTKKPRGVMAALVHVRVEGVDAEPRLVAIATRSPAVVQHPLDLAGKTAEYRVRWLNTTGQAGAAGDAVRAMIAA